MEICIINAAYLSQICLILASYMMQVWLWRRLNDTDIRQSWAINSVETVIFGAGSRNMILMSLIIVNILHFHFLHITNMFICTVHEANIEEIGAAPGQTQPDSHQGKLGRCMHAARDVNKILWNFTVPGEPSVDYDLWRQESQFYIYLPWLNTRLVS